VVGSDLFTDVVCFVIHAHQIEIGLFSDLAWRMYLLLPGRRCCVTSRLQSFGCGPQRQRLVQYIPRRHFIILLAIHVCDLPPNQTICSAIRMSTRLK
jgi:hypothetical protein